MAKKSWFEDGHYRPAAVIDELPKVSLATYEKLCMLFSFIFRYDRNKAI